MDKGDEEHSGHEKQSVPTSEWHWLTGAEIRQPGQTEKKGNSRYADGKNDEKSQRDPRDENTRYRRVRIPDGEPPSVEVRDLERDEGAQCANQVEAPIRDGEDNKQTQRCEYEPCGENPVVGAGGTSQNHEF